MGDKTVWIINQYGSLPITGLGGRHRHLARELTKLGHKVSLVSARWTHGTRNEDAAMVAPEEEVFEGFKFVRISVDKYKHAHDKKRIVNWFMFALRLLKLPKKLQEHPDVIIYSSPSLVGFLGAQRLAKKTGAKLIMEIRDIWPLTLIKVGGFSSNHPFIRFMSWIENRAYRMSDLVISNLEGFYEHLKNFGVPEERFSWVPNGYSEDDFQATNDDEDKVANEIRRQPFSVTYTGALGQANGLDTLLGAARLLKRHSHIHINIIGRGRLENELKLTATENQLDNVTFWGAIEKQRVHAVLSESDACVICWKKVDLYRYGIAANKIFDYLYSGRPIINSYSGSYDLVTKANAGLTVEAENERALADGIYELSLMDKRELNMIGENGRKYVQAHHNYAIIAKALDAKFEQVIAQ